MTYDEIRDETFVSDPIEGADYRATWPNGNEPDGETTVTISVHGSAQAGGYILVCDDHNSGGDAREAGETVYGTAEEAIAAAEAYAREHDESE